jgi:3-methyladenine DNA glycosylase AlkC
MIETCSSESIHYRVRNEVDTVRAIGAIAIAGDESTTQERRLELLRPFANDQHFGVREWAWIGLRDNLGSDLLLLLETLSAWAEDDQENIRRFASEISRPCGVWTKHIAELKEMPWLGLPILDRLRSDESRYVQRSVGNWLNDAGKTMPDWVKTLCDEWRSIVDAKDRSFVLRLALRGISR